MTSSSSTTAPADRPIYDLAADKLRELVEAGNLEAIRLAMTMSPCETRVDMTC